MSNVIALTKLVKSKRLQVVSCRMMSNSVGMWGIVSDDVRYCKIWTFCVFYMSFYVETSTQAKKIITFYRKGIDSAIRFKDTR